MRKLNIALVHDNIGNIVDGAITSTKRFGKLLAEKGHKVIYISGKKRREKIIPDETHEGIKIYRFNSLAIKQHGRSFLISFPNLKRLEKILKDEKIDVVHVMIPNPSALTTIKAAKNLGISIVAHSHTQPENLFVYLPNCLRFNMLNKLFYRYLIWLYKKADVVICPSKFSERLLKKYNPGLKTEVISNGVNLSRFKKANPEKFFSRHGIQKGKERILFVGRVDPEKCIDTLLGAMPLIMKKYKNVHLDIVGTGILHDKMKLLSSKLKLDKNVTFYGKIPDDELVSAYNSADIFVLPSLTELEGMVVLEAMACGKPIVIANSPNSAAVDFVSENGVVFNPQDSKDLADKLLRLLGNKKLRTKMGKKSSENIKKYDLLESVEKLENIYYKTSKN